jgi:hypothetical protein
MNKKVPLAVVAYVCTVRILVFQKAKRSQVVVSATLVCYKPVNASEILHFCLCSLVGSESLRCSYHQA